MRWRLKTRAELEASGWKNMGADSWALHRPAGSEYLVARMFTAAHVQVTSLPKGKQDGFILMPGDPQSDQTYWTAEMFTPVDTDLIEELLA